MSIWDSHTNDTKKKLDHWVYLYEKFHLKYIIQSTENGNDLVTEDSRFIKVMIPTCFINIKIKKDFV